MRFPIVLLICCSLAGCVTYSTVRPAVSGTVVAAPKRTPLGQASLSVVGEKMEVLTDPAGRFALPARRGWVFYPIIFPVDHLPRNTLTVRRAGYVAREIPLLGTARQRGLVVELKPAGAHP